MGLATLCKFVVGELSSSVNDCILFFCTFYTATKLIGNLSCTTEDPVTISMAHFS